jgi:hypothetical protein
MVGSSGLGCHARPWSRVGTLAFVSASTLAVTAEREAFATLLMVGAGSLAVAATVVPASFVADITLATPGPAHGNPFRATAAHNGPFAATARRPAFAVTAPRGDL